MVNSFGVAHIKRVADVCHTSHVRADEFSAFFTNSSIVENYEAETLQQVSVWNSEAIDILENGFDEFHASLVSKNKISSTLMSQNINVDAYNR